MQWRKILPMRFLISALIATLMFALAPTAQAIEEREMGTHRAGQVYLNTVCPVNNEQNRYSKRIFGNRNAITVREANRRLPELRRLSGRLSTVANRTSRGMFNPPAEWPADVQRYATRIGDAYADSAYYLQSASRATSGRQWGRFQTKYANVSVGNASARLRARLDLPPPGEGC